MTVETESSEVVEARRTILRLMLSSGNHNCDIKDFDTKNWTQNQLRLLEGDESQALCPAWGDCRLQELAFKYQVKAKPTDRVGTLSGGNIQKLILARTLSREPRFVIAAQPTRGLDVGATAYVHERLLEQRERGAAVLLVSEDLDEVLRLSDRVLVMFGGRVVADLAAAQAERGAVGLLMAGEAAGPHDGELLGAAAGNITRDSAGGHVGDSAGERQTDKADEAGTTTGA